MKHFNFLVLALIFSTLTACGGGDEGYGDGDGSDTGNVGDLSISLSLLDEVSGLATTTISSNGQGILQATVTSGGTPLASELVTFSTTLGELNPVLGTALTDANGVASIILSGGTVGGAGTATVEIQIGDETVSDLTNFSVTSSIVATTISMGNGTGDTFVPGVINLGGITTLSAGGTLIATVNIVDTSNANTPYTSLVDVTFESTCTLAGTASMVSPITTANGIASSTYVANGCVGTDIITARASIDGITYTALASITVLTTIDMGNGTGNAFVPDVINLDVTTLSAGGTLLATVNIVDVTSANAPYTTPVDVAFESTCTLAGTASMGSPITTANGVASSTYTASGCIGPDTIIARATVGVTTYTAQASVTVLSPEVGSIQFTSASQEVIAIQGTGGWGLSETSIIVFTVYDATGNPVSGKSVDFVLSTTVGGITLVPSSAATDIDGQVQTVVNSGTVNTSVQVIATVTGTTPAISTGSVALAISTGLPDQNSFSIAMETLNPAAWETNGVIVPVTIYVADHFNNPAPDGTAIAFQTEGGFIDGSCTTTTGRCTVNWVSSDPRPLDGRVTILATAIGEEGFTDTNGNGRFDNGEPFTDLPEAWRDDDESGSREGTEEFLDFDVNGSYGAANSLYNGTLCGAGATLCDPGGALIHTRSSSVLIMASRTQLVSVFDTLGTLSTTDDINVTFSGLEVKDNGDITQIRVDVQDARGQVPPMGTTVKVSSDNPISKLLGGAGAGEGIVPNTSSPGPFSVYADLQAVNIGSGSGSDVITVTLGAPEEASTTLSIPISLIDVTGPTTTKVTPGFGESGVAVDATISVTFSEAMDAATVTTIGNITFDPALAGTWYYDPSTLKAIFLADANMLTNAIYTVTVTTAVQDLAGNPLNSVDGSGAAAQVWAFKTVP